MQRLAKEIKMLRKKFGLSQFEVSIYTGLRIACFPILDNADIVF